MGKALVIKGANFSANKVTTVEFGDIPCEGISLSQSVINISSFDSVEVECTVTPANTTDQVVWESSNINVLTVDNGVITPVGIGSCTIKATCGNYSASADVTVNISIVPVWEFISSTPGGNNKFVAYGGKVYGQLAAFASGSLASNYRAVANSTNYLEYPFFTKIPKNVAKIKISATNPSLFYSDATYWSHRIHWLSDEPCGDENYPNAAKYVSSEQFNAKNALPKEFEIPEGANCFLVNLKTAATYQDTDPNVVANTTLGVSIEFIPVGAEPAV